MNNPIQIIEQLIKEIDRDSYRLPRGDRDSIECQLRNVQEYIKQTYEKRGHKLI